MEKDKKAMKSQMFMRQLLLKRYFGLLKNYTKKSTDKK